MNPSPPPPTLTWVKLESHFEGDTPTNAFYGARFPHGWLVWNHLNQTMAFVPDPPPPPSPAR